MAKTIGSFDLASLKNLRDDVTQYFWFESDSSSAWGSGAHVTLYPESQFTNSTSPNYMKGQNIIMNTDGFSIRNGGLPMMVLDNNSLDFNMVDTSEGTYVTTATFANTGAQIGQTSGAHIQISNFGFDINLDSSTNIANFGTNGARIGKLSGAHSVIDANGQRFYATNGTTQLANIGYGLSEEFGVLSSNPYYTFGTRENDYAEAYDQTKTYNVGDCCSYDDKLWVCKEKIETPMNWDSNYWIEINIGSYSFSNGKRNISSNLCSYAEGMATRALGTYSHAQNEGTITYKRSQTVIGTYNKLDVYQGDHLNLKGRYSFIIGNGSNFNDRSNGLAITWNGTVESKNGYYCVLRTDTPTINTSVGTLVSKTCRRQGNIVQLLLTIKNTNSVAAGDNLYEGTIANDDSSIYFRPDMVTTAGTYYGQKPILATISTNGGIVVRNSSSSAITLSSNLNISFTYLTSVPLNNL